MKPENNNFGSLSPFFLYEKQNLTVKEKVTKRIIGEAYL